MNSPMNNQLLNDIYNVAEDLNLDNHNPNTYTDIESRIIGTLTSVFFNKNPILDFESELTLQEKLIFNGIHLRKVDIPSYYNLLLSKKSINILLRFEDDSYKLLLPKRGKERVYDPQNNSMYEEKPRSSLKDLSVVEAFELYPQLGYKVENPFQILKFSFGRYFGVIIGVVIVSLILMVFNLVQPIITQFITQTAIPSSDESVLYDAIIPAILIGLVSGGFRYFQSLITLRLETEVDLNLQTAVWERTFKLPLNFISEYSSGDLNSRIQSISTLRRLLGNQSTTLFISFIFSFVYFIVMYLADSNLTWLALIVTLTTIILTSFSVYKQAIYQWPLLQKQSDLTSFAFESVNGVAQIRTTETEPYILSNWARKISELSDLQRTYTYWQDVIEIISQSVQPVGALVLFTAVVTNLINSASSIVEVYATLAMFFPFYSAYSAFNQNMNQVFTTVANVAGAAIVNWRRAKPVLFADQEIGYSPDSIVRDINGSVQFKNIHFSFKGAQTPIFENVSFDVPAGSFTAITGPSGSGKSTLLSLLLGFNSPQIGTCQVDGIPIYEYNIRNLRKQFGIVMQLAPLPAGTIFEVVCSGQKYTEDEVWNALELACVAEQIRSMPLGLDTVLNESSQGISGGQRQRIAIARAIISNPKILLMDEATSALDNEAQSTITENLKQIKCTQIVIAHRLSTIRDADQIIYLDKTVKCKGKFSELVDAGLIKLD